MKSLSNENYFETYIGEFFTHFSLNDKNSYNTNIHKPDHKSKVDHILLIIVGLGEDDSPTGPALNTAVLQEI